MNRHAQLVQQLVSQNINIKKLPKSKLISLAVFAAILSAKPAMALGEYFSGGFSSVVTYRWIYSNMTSQYASAYVIPGAGSQWNGISSRVSLTRVTTGSYVVNAQVATGTDPSVTGLTTVYCASGSGSICASSTWSSARIYGYENAMAASSYTTTQRIKTFTHEFGHTLSLSHVTNGSAAVMAQGKSDLGVQAYDKANLRAKWGN